MQEEIMQITNIKLNYNLYFSDFNCEYFLGSRNSGSDIMDNYEIDIANYGYDTFDNKYHCDYM